MSYPGNYVAEHPICGNDSCCPGYKEPYYDGEEIKTCALCGELLELTEKETICEEPVCDYCYTNTEDTMDEKIRMINKFKR